MERFLIIRGIPSGACLMKSAPAVKGNLKGKVTWGNREKKRRKKLLLNVPETIKEKERLHQKKVQGESKLLLRHFGRGGKSKTSL